MQATEAVDKILLDRSSIWTTRMLWINSVCIDYNAEKVENMENVRLERRIFSQAFRVVVWLSYCQDSGLAVAQMENSLVNSRKYVEHLSELGSVVGDLASTSWKGWKEIFSHPWLGGEYGLFQR